VGSDVFKQPRLHKSTSERVCVMWVCCALCVRWSPLLYADFQAKEDCVLSLLAVNPQSQLQLLGE
jgi:hypothetical protein